MSITTDMRGGGLMVVTLNEPERRNPLGHGVRQALVEVMGRAEATMRCAPWC